MEKIVKNSTKAEFIEWFLQEHTLKKRECVWILNYLASKGNLLRNVHFVESAEGRKNGMILTTACANQVGDFVFFEDKHTYHRNPEKGFHHIRINQKEQYYIELRFKDKFRHSKYLEVLEDDHVQQDVKISSTTESLIENLEYSFQLKNLQERIDQSLVNNDMESFLSLSNEYNELLANKPEEKYKMYKR